MMNLRKLSEQLNKVNGSFGAISSYSSAVEALKVRFEFPNEDEWELVCIGCSYIGGPTCWSNVDVNIGYLDDRKEHLLIEDSKVSFRVICADAKLESR